MKPIDHIAKLYREIDMPRDMQEDIDAHLANGYVISTPEFFVMGRAIARDASAVAIDNPWFPFKREHQDTWLVYAFAGSSRNFLSFVPYPLRWLAWQRRGKPLRFHEFSHFTRHASIKSLCEPSA